MLLRVAESDLDEAREFLLVDLIETYCELNAEEMTRYESLVARKEYRKVQDVELTWADKLLRVGEEKGLERGLVQGKRESLLKVLDTKFGSVSAKTHAKLEAMESAEELDACLARAMKADSLEETGLVD